MNDPAQMNLACFDVYCDKYVVADQAHNSEGFHIKEVHREDVAHVSFEERAPRHLLLPEGGDVDAQVTLMAMPVFLSQILPAGFIGIIAAGMLAAFMSTHDSYLLCWSSVLTQDVVAPWFKKGLSSKTRLCLARFFVVTIGIFILVWGLWYPLGQDLWDYMAISGAVYFSGAIALLVFDLYWKRASKVGAYLALICGFGAIVGLKPVQVILGIDVSSAAVGLTVILLATASMVIGSLLFADKNEG